MTALLALVLLAGSPTPRVGPPVLVAVRGIVTELRPFLPQGINVRVRWDDRAERDYPPRILYLDENRHIRFRGRPGWPTELRPGDRISLAWCPAEQCFNMAICVDRDIDLPMAFVVEQFACEARCGVSCNGLDPDTWALCEALGADRCKVRDWATRMLQRRGESAWRELAHALGHRDPEVRDRAARLANPMVGVVAVQDPDDWEAK